MPGQALQAEISLFPQGGPCARDLAGAETENILTAKTLFPLFCCRISQANPQAGFTLRFTENFYSN